MSELCRKISWGFPTYKAKKICKYSRGLGREEDRVYCSPRKCVTRLDGEGKRPKGSAAVAPLWWDNRAGDGAGGGLGGGHVVMPPLRVGLSQGARARKVLHWEGAEGRGACTCLGREPTQHRALGGPGTSQYLSWKETGCHRDRNNKKIPSIWAVLLQLGEKQKHGQRVICGERGDFRQTCLTEDSLTSSTHLCDWR